KLGPRWALPDSVWATLHEWIRTEHGSSRNLARPSRLDRPSRDALCSVSSWRFSVPLTANRWRSRDPLRGRISRFAWLLATRRRRTRAPAEWPENAQGRRRRRGRPGRRNRRPGQKQEEQGLERAGLHRRLGPRARR